MFQDVHLPLVISARDVKLSRRRHNLIIKSVRRHDDSHDDEYVTASRAWLRSSSLRQNTNAIFDWLKNPCVFWKPENLPVPATAVANAWAGWSVAFAPLCVCVCPRSKKKTAWAINTKLSSQCHILLWHGSRRVRDPKVKRSKVKVTRSSNARPVYLGF